MLEKLALALSAPFVVGSAQPPNPQFADVAYVHQVVCDQGRGTAFRVGRNTVLSVDHVTRLGNCSIEGERVDILHESAADFSVLRVSGLETGGLPISCEGFTAGQRYRAIGYANGLPIQRRIDIVSTGERGPRGLAVLVGEERFIPGMSGGPVLNESGVVVGMVNAYSPFYPISFSLPLSETRMCGGGNA